MKFLRYLATAVLFFVLGVNTVFALTIKLGSIAPPGSPWDLSFRKLASEWHEISNGEVSLKIYAGGVVGDEPAMVRKMRIGQLNAAGIVGPGLSKIYPGILALLLPLLVQTEEEFDYVFDKMKPFYEEELEKRGFKAMAWTTMGWTNFFSKKPITTLDDLRKQRLWIWAAEPPEVQAWQEAGFHVVSFPSTEVMVGLQSGMVDAFVANPIAAAFFQWFATAPNMSNMKLAPIFGAIVVSTKSWNKIPPEIRPQLLEAARKAGDAVTDTAIEIRGEAIVVMEENGLVVHPVPDTIVEEWNSITTGFRKLGGELVDREAYEKVKFHLEEFRKNNAD